METHIVYPEGTEWGRRHGDHRPAVSLIWTQQCEM
jgi:hypothetical protein